MSTLRLLATSDRRSALVARSVTHRCPTSATHGQERPPQEDGVDLRGPFAVDVWSGRARPASPKPLLPSGVAVLAEIAPAFVVHSCWSPWSVAERAVAFRLSATHSAGQGPGGRASEIAATPYRPTSYDVAGRQLLLGRMDVITSWLGDKSKCRDRRSRTSFGHVQRSRPPASLRLDLLGNHAQGPLLGRQRRG